MTGSDHDRDLLLGQLIDCSIRSALLALLASTCGASAACGTMGRATTTGTQTSGSTGGGEGAMGGDSAGGSGDDVSAGGSGSSAGSGSSSAGGSGSGAGAVTDGSGPEASGSAVVPPATVTDLTGLVPDGQCPQGTGALLGVSLDGASLDSLGWKVTNGGANHVILSSASATAGDAGLGFTVTIPYTGLVMGTQAPGPLGVIVNFSPPAVDCTGSAVSGGVRASLIADCSVDAGSPACMSVGLYARVCGAYDLACANSSGSHHVHLRATFNVIVPLSAAPGGGR